MRVEHRYPRRGRRSRRGLTLLECLVASLLLALGASAVMMAVSAGMQQQRYAEEQRSATQLAQQLLEQVSARAYLHPSNPDYATLEPTSAQAMDGYADSVDATGENATGVDAYERSISVTDAADEGVTAIPGVGIATAVVTTPSGTTIQLRRILPAQ
jgi:prepilin-type N-terminal cleavage/methylation domain-containing protein